MKPINTIDLIKSRLQTAFSPSYLQVIDESDEHIGHPGHQGGARHFAIEINAACLNNLSRIAAHQQIYGLFTELMPNQIHALKIKIINRQ